MDSMESDGGRRATPSEIGAVLLSGTLVEGSVYLRYGPYLRQGGVSTVRAFRLDRVPCRRRWGEKREYRATSGTSTCSLTWMPTCITTCVASKAGPERACVCYGFISPTQSFGRQFPPQLERRDSYQKTSSYTAPKQPPR
ncbi:hypothetical protein VUR80DRAFT_5930 [Thermomyces stellatus]